MNTQIPMLEGHVLGGPNPPRVRNSGSPRTQALGRSLGLEDIHPLRSDPAYKPWSRAEATALAACSPAQCMMNLPLPLLGAERRPLTPYPSLEPVVAH